MTDIPVAPIAPGSEPAAHYDTVVDAWGELLQDDLHYGYFMGGTETLVAATDELTNQMLALAQIESGNDALDVGCGTGRAACRMAGERGASVTGISPSAVCVERAQALAESQGLSATFQEGDGTKMSLPDESYDRIWVMESSHLMQDKVALISECARVLKPYGRVVLCDIILQKKLPLAEVIAHRDEFLLLRDVFGRAIMEPLSFYATQFQSQGLNVVQQRDISSETFPTFARWRDNAESNRERVCKMIGEHAWRQFLMSCDVLESFWRDGILGYGIIAAEKPG